MTDLLDAAFALADRLRRAELSAIKDDLDRRGVRDLNALQAQLLRAVGRGAPSASELQARGRDFGSNLAYNVRKLVDAGYLAQRPAAHDRRAIELTCTAKGLQLCDALDAAAAARAQRVRAAGADDERLQALVRDLRALEAGMASARASSAADLRHAPIAA